MNAKLLTIALIVVIGGGGFVLWQLFTVDVPEPASSNAPSGATTSESVSGADETLELSGTGTLATLLQRGRALECTISYVPEEPSAVAVEGTYFVSNERMRGDFLTTAEGGEEYLASMIMDGDTLYTWSEVEGETYGMRIDLSELPEDTENAPDTREPVPLDANVSYDCTPWENVDATVFVPPSDVVFTDFSDVMQGGMEFGTIYEENGSADPCASCEQLPGEARTQCRAALSCE